MLSKTRVPAARTIAAPAAIILPAILSVVAGSADVITFLGLGGLLSAHITGNMAILAAHIVSGVGSTVAPLLSVPTFIVALCIARALAEMLRRHAVAALGPLLLLQAALLFGALAAVGGSRVVDPNAANAIVAGMCCVCAMAVQSALVPLSLPGAPTTNVMTTNVTHFVLDLWDVLIRPESPSGEQSWSRAMRILPAVVGFAAGCAAGAACEAAFGLRSLALPAATSVLALAVPAMSTASIPSQATHVARPSFPRVPQSSGDHDNIR